MRSSLCHLLVGLCLWGNAFAVQPSSESQGIYRCGNAYTNQPDPVANCTPIAAGSVTVIEGTRVQNPRAASPAVNPSVASSKVDSGEQRQRDIQAHAVLQAELEKSQRQYAELVSEWNNGEPERRPDERNQPQKYQDRIIHLRAALQRTEADIAGLKRELSRLPSAPQTGNKP